MASTEATNSSTIMPAAPTNMRCQRLGKDHAADASTYGVGMNTRNMMPSSWHSPPNRRQAKAWPSSWISLMPTNTAHSHSQFDGSIEFAAAAFSSRHCGSTNAPATRIVPIQMNAPTQLNTCRITGSQRTRKLSGSHSGMRGNSTFIKRFCIFRLFNCLLRRSRTVASGVTSASIRLAEYRWLRIWMISGCVGASSANCPPQMSQACSTVRLPSSSPMKR
jgi:hypothetical protein